MRIWQWSHDCAGRDCGPCRFPRALKEICLQVGYRYQEMGRPSVQSMTVVVRGQNRPAHELLEDIAWQVQPVAVVRVDPINRTVTLARTSGREARS